MADSGSYEYQNEFADVVKSTKGKEAWWSVDVMKYVTKKNAYVCVSVLSFTLMAIFGIVSMYLHDDCLVAKPEGRCCACLDVNATMMGGQEMPMRQSRNSLFYGILMLLNSFFGIYYVWNGVTTENKYQLLCMLVTQFLECSRGLVDTLLEEADSPDAAKRREINKWLMICASVLFLVSCSVVYPVYQSFGWRSFRRAGAKRSVLQMYKMYQRFRALNRLDVQSSFLLFIIFLGYLAETESQGAWVWICLFLTDSIASRAMVKYLKQEDMRGVIISVIAKTFVVIWWIVVVVQYLGCYERYTDSLARTKGWFDGPFYPDLKSVADSYNGVNCLAPKTFHDARTFEVMVLNLVQALVFRFSSVGIAYVVVRNFGKGLKHALYDIEDAPPKPLQPGDKDETEDDSDGSGDEQPMRFIPKKSASPSASTSAVFSPTKDTKDAGSTNASMAGGGSPHGLLNTEPASDPASQYQAM